MFAVFYFIIFLLMAISSHEVNGIVTRVARKKVKKTTFGSNLV
jgi:hypothetical protein